MARRRLTEKERGILRQAKSVAEEKVGVGGLARTKHKPKAVTLPTITILKDEGEQ